MASGIPTASEKKPPSTSKHAKEIKDCDKSEETGVIVVENVDEKVSAPGEAEVQRAKGFFKGITAEMRLNIFS